MKVRIDKLSKNKNTFDTNLPLEGSAPMVPAIKRSFFVFGVDHGGLTTSTVQEVEEVEDGWILTTLNSNYEVTKLDK